MPKIRLFNPKQRSRPRKIHRRKNVEGTLTYMANPTRKHRRHVRHNMKHKHRNPIFGKARRHNMRYNMHRRYHRRHNPLGIPSLKSVAKNTAVAIGAGVLSRSVPQAVLGVKNTGIAGYAANAATAVAVAAITEKLLPGTGEAALLGGAVMLAGRILNEQLGRSFVEFSEINLPLPKLAGEFRESGFVVPYSSLPGGRVVVCPPAAAAPAVPARTMHGPSRFDRWN